MWGACGGMAGHVGSRVSVDLIHYVFLVSVYKVPEEYGSCISVNLNIKGAQLNP